MRTAILAFGSTLTVTAALLILLRPNTPKPAPAADQTDPTSADVDALVKEALRAFQVPGVAVAVVRDDKVIHLKAYGVREAGKAEPITPDTLFPIASCTKAFTTTAMAMLVDEGKMDWDDAVRKHVDYFRLADPLADEQVTLRDLVCHRTGVGSNDFLWYRSPWRREEVIRRVGLVKPKYGFRAGFEYQSTMFTTAGVAVEKASGLRWEEFVHKRICAPLGMTRVRFTTPAARADADHATPHRVGSEGKVLVMPWYSIDRPEPAGSMHASVRDLANWARFQLSHGECDGKRLVSASSLRETHAPQNIIRLEGTLRDLHPDTTLMSYGMAWVIQDYRGEQLVSHAGVVDGFRAHITLVPRHRIGIVLLNNLDRTQMNLALSNSIVDRLLGLERKDWPGYVREQVRLGEEAGRAKVRAWQARRQQGTKPTCEMDAYVGTYEDAAYGQARVALEGGALVWKWSTFSSALEHYHFDTFVLNNETLGFPAIEFRLDSDGDVAALRVAFPLDVEFRKVRKAR